MTSSSSVPERARAHGVPPLGCSALLLLLAALVGACSDSSDANGELSGDSTGAASIDEGLTRKDTSASDPAKTLGGQTGDEFQTGQIIQRLVGDAERLAPSGPAMGAASADLAEFSWAFYRQTADLTKNFVFSPYSISTAAAMLYAGAGGNTKTQMAEALHFMGAGDEFHQARNDLAQFLDARNTEAVKGRAAQALTVSNDFWVAPNLSPEKTFLNVLSANYGAAVHWTNFAEFEKARQAINGKVAEDTNSLIKELLPPGAIDLRTVFVLTNALYFKASWASSFSRAATEKTEFMTAAGDEISVEMMFVDGTPIRYTETASYEAVAIPYSGNLLEFVALAPPPGTFREFAAAVSSEVIDEASAALRNDLLNLRFPKFETETELPLKDELQAAGMVDAFDFGLADFAPLVPPTPEGSVWISRAFHKTKIVLDEEGSEAAGATAFVGAPPPSSPTPRDVTIDRPFVYFIRDVETQAVLFVGHFVGVE